MNLNINIHAGIYILRAEQLLPCTLAQAWQYFATPGNLQRITPDDMSFEITSGAHGKIYPGKIITYHVRIFPFIKSKWITEITQVTAECYFIDEQRKGPYALWHHEHHFEKRETGILMTDIVSYKLPMGWVGRRVAGNWVKKKLVKIFSFRFAAIKAHFYERH